MKAYVIDASVAIKWYVPEDHSDLAVTFALALNRTVYDCMYLALAIALDGVMITADKWLHRALSGTPYGPFAAGLADL